MLILKIPPHWDLRKFEKSKREKMTKKNKRKKVKWDRVHKTGNSVRQTKIVYELQE